MFNINKNHLLTLFSLLTMLSKTMQVQHFSTEPLRLTGDEMHAIVHIGPHKTASTAIQRAMKKNARRLLEQYNITVYEKDKSNELVLPLTCEPLLSSPYGSRTGYKKKFLPYRDAERQFQHLVTGQHRHVFLSSEACDGILEDGIYILKKTLEAAEHVTIVAYHRHPLAHLWSVYAQASKHHPSPVRFSTFVQRALPHITCGNQWIDASARLQCSNKFNLHGLLPEDKFIQGNVWMSPMLSAWRRAFGAHNIRLVSFEGALRLYADPTKALLNDVMNIRLQSYRRSNHVNASPGSVVLDTLRTLADLNNVPPNVRVYVENSYMNNFIETHVQPALYVLPIVCEDLSGLMALFDKLDLHTRANFGTPILGANATYENVTECRLNLIEIWSDDKKKASLLDLVKKWHAAFGPFFTDNRFDELEFYRNLPEYDGGYNATQLEAFLQEGGEERGDTLDVVLHDEVYEHTALLSFAFITCLTVAIGYIQYEIMQDELYY